MTPGPLCLIGRGVFNGFWLNVGELGRVEDCVVGTEGTGLHASLTLFVDGALVFKQLVLVITVAHVLEQNALLLLSPIHVLQFHLLVVLLLSRHLLQCFSSLQNLFVCLVFRTGGLLGILQVLEA